jgi:hypothetical protein
MQCNAMQCNAMQCNAMQCNLQFAICNLHAMQFAMQCNLIKHGKNLQFTDGKYDKLNKSDKNHHELVHKIAVWK